MTISGVRIRQLRKEAGLTQEALGKKLGVIKQTVSNWENGISEPNSEVLSNIASIFGISIGYLYNDSIPYESALSNVQKKNEDYYFFFFFDENSLLRNTFVKRMKSAIEDKGLTKDEFKERISFGSEKATAFLEGSGEPTANDLIELSQFLDTSIDYLLGQVPKVNNIEKKC